MQTFSEFKKLMTIKRYAPNTVKSYIGLLLAFQKHLPNDIDTLSNFEVCKHITKVVTSQHLAMATQKQLIGALKLYFKEMHNKAYDFSRVYPRAIIKSLPVVLNKKEVKAILESTANPKHKAMLTLIYALGLRSGELISLRLIDIDKQRKQVHIKASKNNKDRILPFPNSLREVLKPYYLKYKPTNYLFYGQHKEQYSSQSLRKVFHKACKEARVKKKVTLHSLRHAYATHLMEAGTDIRIIKELLGHNDIKTTLMYTHVSQHKLNSVPNPLDLL